MALVALWLFLNSPPPDARSPGSADVGGPFSLVDQTGARVTQENFRGRYMFIYFGYTFCPDVCPAELQTMSRALDLLDAKTAARIQPLFFTVDPERDTVEILADYMGHFHPSFRGLTGTKEEVKAAAQSYRVYFARAEDESATDYLMEHSSIIYVMGPDGRFVNHFPYGTSPEEMAAKLEEWVK